MQVPSTAEGSVQEHHDWSETSPSTAVMEAIAALEHVHSTDLHMDPGITLYDYVDSEALDALVTNDNDVCISFPVNEYNIHIDGNMVTITSR